VKYVLFYRPVADILERVGEHFLAHSARLDEFHARGSLLMVGAFGDPVGQGSMSIWTSREAAEEFMREDPFLLHGLVESTELREWDEVLT
jgi:uncharacterized protein